MTRSCLSCVAALFALWCGEGAQALSTDRDQPVRIESDRAEADWRTRVSVYHGDVVITQGTLRITGDTIRIYLDEDDEFVKLVSVGEPATMRQLPDDSAQYRTAKANRLEYYADRDLIVLLGGAEYGQGSGRTSAGRIEYDSRNGRLKANARSSVPGQEQQEGSRVRITIEPKDERRAP